MTVTDTTTSKPNCLHAAAIYRLIELRVQFMAATVADAIEYLGDTLDQSRIPYDRLTARYRELASWLDEPIIDRQNDELPILLALAKFVAFVNADRQLVDLITDNATIVGDDDDRQHVGLATAQLIRWIDKKNEVRLRAAMVREIGGAA